MIRKKTLLSIVAGLTILLHHPVANAQTVPTVYVFGEKDQAANTSCNASHRSAVATVQATLRNNNIQVASSAKDYSYIHAYVNINALQLRNGCAAAFVLNFQNYQQIEEEYTKKKIWVSVVFCHRDFIVTGDAPYLYSTLQESFRDMTNQCISTYIEKLNG